MSHPFSSRSKVAGAIGLTLSVAAAVILIVLHYPNTAPAAVEPKAAVVTSLAVRGSLSASVLAYGTVVSAPGHTLAIVMPHEGTIAAVHVHDGDAVRAGQAIVTIAIAPAAAAQFSQALAALDFAKADLARVERLFGEKLAANDQLAAARRAYTDAQAQFDQQTHIGTDRAQDTLRAPFAGVIFALTGTPGDRPVVGAAIATLASRSDVVLQLGLEPTDAAGLAPGAPVRLDLPQGGVASIKGTLIAVGAAIDPVSRLVKAVAQIAAADAAHLTLGMTLIAHIDLPARQGVVFSRGALLEDAAGPFIFRVVDGKAHRMPVHILVETNTQTLIDGNLADGTRVIVSGNAALEEGVAVQEVKP